MKKLLMAVMLGLVLSLVTPMTASAAPYCGITWGSLPKSAADAGAAGTLNNIRTGRHDCYDRMVLDLSNTGEGYDVSYVDNVYMDGSGQLVPLAGGAKLRIIARAPSHNLAGVPTYSGVAGAPLPGVNLAGYQTFRNAKFAGSFEGQSTVGLGVRARLPFRVFRLDNRAIVDVAHAW